MQPLGTNPDSCHTVLLKVQQLWSSPEVLLQFSRHLIRECWLQFSISCVRGKKKTRQGCFLRISETEVVILTCLDFIYLNAFPTTDIDRISVMKNQFLFMVWFIKYLQISFTCDQQLLKGFSVDWYISLYMWILTLEPVFCHFNVKLRVSWLIRQYKEKTDLNWTGRGQHWTWCTTLDRIHLRFILP